MFQWILTKLGTYLVLRRVWNPIDFQGHRVSRINIFQWILTKLGTYLVLKKIWNPIDFQDQRVKVLPRIILVNTLESTSFNGF
jgi:hypothetical protein